MKSKIYSWVVLFVFIISAGQVAVAVAEDKPTAEVNNKKKAKAAFNRGKASFDNNKYKDAANAFREAYKLMPSWKLLYNIGQAEAASKRYGLALDSFEKYLALGGDGVDEERKEDVIKEITRLRAMVGSIEITAPDGAIIFIDNVERGRAPLPGRIKVTAAIEHTVFVELDSEQILSRPVIVSGGETLTIKASKKESVETAQKIPQENTVKEDNTESVSQEGVQADEKPAKKSPLIMTGWILTGTGAATLLGGMVAGIVAISKNNKLKDSCDEESGLCDPSKNDDISSVKSASTASTILLTAGGVIAATGVVLLITGIKRKERLNKVSIIPVFSPEFNGLQISGRF